MLSVEEIKLDLKNRLSVYRYCHSVRVAEETKKLAIYYGIDEEEAYLAGLIHDVAKEFSVEENRKWVCKYGLSEELLKEDNYKFCHAEIGAIVAKVLYNVSDKVCQAIRYHTIGNINMNMLDKIVFVADKIDSGKDYLGIEKERYLAYRNIDEALILCLQNNKVKLESEGKVFNKSMENLLEYLNSKKVIDK